MTSEPIAHPLTDVPVLTGRDEHSPVLIDATQSGIVILTLNRPDKNNVLGPELAVALSDAFDTLKGADHVRAVFLRGAGGRFCAGIDPDYIAQSADWLEDDIREDALRLATMLKKLNDLPQITVALVDGAAFDAGAGLVAACDLAVATEQATFAFSEVRLGLSPAAASPYLVRAVGARNARVLLATGREFTASDALKWGLVQEVVADAAQFGPLVAVMGAAMRDCAPGAVADVKRLVNDVADRPIDHALLDYTAHAIARRRASAEGREGVRAFLDNRKPSWTE
jgi:methylglutaconyl-CoA hydratase